MAGILQKKSKAFISWSGDKARTCADFLSDLLNKIFAWSTRGQVLET